MTSLGPLRTAVVQRVVARARRRGAFPNALSAALTACVLLNYGSDGDGILDRAVKVIADHQRADGSWPRIAFFSGPRRPCPRSEWYGSEDLTTAFCVEALARSVLSA